MTPYAVSKRFSKTKFRTAFMMAGEHFANYMFTPFSETGYWDTIRGRVMAGSKQVEHVVEAG
jgi:hypothetical protein